MKKRLTRGYKLLLAASISLIPFVGIAWAQQKPHAQILEFPASKTIGLFDFSPDNKRLSLLICDYQTKLFSTQVYDLESGAKVCDLATPSRLASIPDKSDYFGRVVWSPDGKRLASNPLGDCLMIWDAQTGAVLAQYPETAKPQWYWSSHELRFSEDGKTLIAGRATTAIYDVATGKRLDKADRKIVFAKSSKDDWRGVLNEKLSLIAIVDRSDGKFWVADAKTKKVLWQPKLGYNQDTVWHDDILCVQDNYFKVRSPQPAKNRFWLWNGKTRQLLPSPTVANGTGIGNYSFSPDKRTLAYVHLKRTPDSLKTGKAAAQLVGWDYKANREVWRTRTIPLNYLEMGGLLWSPDGKMLCTYTVEEPATHLYVFGQNGKLRYECKSVGILFSWSNDSKQLAFTPLDMANPNHPDNRLEIHRFED